MSTSSADNQAGVRYGTETAYTRARAAAEQNSAIEFRGDGTWRRVDKSTFLAMGGHNPVTGGNIVIGGDPVTARTQGRWNAGGGRLYMVSDKDQWEEYRYEVVRRPEGRVLRLTSGRSCDIWTEAR